MKFFIYLLFPLFALLFNPIKPPKPISCAPAGYTFRATITSTQSGNWSDPATWGGKVPVIGDAVTVTQGHVVFIDKDATVAGMHVAGTLWLDMGNSITVTSTKNILVTGLLQMTPATPSIIHTLRFTGINEANFAGGGMDPVASDVGLWVMDAGRLQLQGSDKTSWTNANVAIPAGTSTFTVDDATGWQPGDEIIITATAAGATNYDTRTIKKVTSNIVDMSTSVTAHPVINNQWTAEVGNLTRNVRIEGTANGKSHIFIRSTSRQILRNVAFRYLGPRKDQNSDGIKDLVLGRYGLHFHHCMDGSDGSIVDGCVMRDIGNHAYVPHVSNGVTMSNNIAVNCIDAPFWWDLPDATHRTLWTGNLVIQPSYVEGALSQDTKGAPTFGTHAFVLGMGDDNRCDSNVVAGQQGLETTNAAYDWEEMPVESAWTFKGNLVHNSDCGIRSWQNNGKNHVLENSIIYNCKTGVHHGAYINNYTYQGGSIYNAVFEIHAASGENGVRIENMKLDGAGLVDYPLHMVPTGNADGIRPIFVRNCSIKGGKKGAVLNESATKLKSIDLIQCEITGATVVASTALLGETIRVQPVTGQPYKVTKSGKTNITAFAPTSWGTGTGLQGQYFNNADFTNPAFTRIDPLINFPEWMIPLPGKETGVHYLIKDETYSARWTGFVEPQFSETYRFSVLTGGGVRLWIDGKLLLDKWSDVYPTTYTSAGVSLPAGKRYSVKIEYLNNDDRSALYLYWQSTSQPLQLVPQTQLYLDAVKPPDPPVNQAPSANAGQDETINLQFTLIGSGSDQDGFIVAYKWEKVSGPDCVILSPEKPTTVVNKVQPGTYVFRLTVTDDKGATASSTVTQILQ